MTALTWDGTGQKVYETGVDHGVLYLQDASGDYVEGYAWNGLTAVTESPTGAEATPTYADNIKYGNIISAEEFAATIEAYTYPAEFEQCDGSATLATGVTIGQQNRRPFGFAYRTLVGNDLEGTEHGYKLHLVYGGLAAPSEKARATVNESPEMMQFSWELTTTPVAVSGTNPATGKPFKPTAHLVIDSRDVSPADLAELEDMLYGTVGADPMMPLPAAVAAIFSATLTEAVPTEPGYAAGVITIPAITGVIYKMDGVVLDAGAQPAITEDKIVTASPAVGYKFPAVIDDDWFFEAP